MELNIVKHPLVDKILTYLLHEKTKDSRFHILGKQLTLFPDTYVGYIGLERNDTTAVAGNYYCKFPV